MTKLYLYLKEHRKMHPALFTEFLLIFPAYPATYSMRAATYMTITLTLLLMATKVSGVIAKKFFSNVTAYIFIILLTSTYATLIFMITEALFPGHLRLMLLPFSFLSMNSILTNRFSEPYKDITITSCFVDGIVFFFQTIFVISIIATLGITKLYSSQSAFAILALSISFFILKFCKLYMEQKILSNSKNTSIIDEEE